MNDPRNISIRDYTYHLPEKKIAKHPLPERDSSRLLEYKRGLITEWQYRDIADTIPEGTFMIFNNTKVVEARVLFQKSTGGVIELFCLEPAAGYPDITTAMMSQQTVNWQCLVGGASKWKHGQVLEKKVATKNGELILQARYLEKKTDHFIIEFSWTPSHLSFAEVLHLAGAVPLPPYIKREVEAEDVDRYQTIYAQFEGSVAAPTAGLHFTQHVFENLELKNIQRDHVTLHVGAGTFKPVKSETMSGHEMHGEFFEVNAFTIKNIIDQLGKPIIAVGTTSLRTIESLYWIGVKTIRNCRLPIADCQLSQWEAYDLEKENVSTKVALQALLDSMYTNKTDKLFGRTELLIAPGYEFKIVNALITNFHQPQSTLLLLVAAFIGRDWRKVYNYALEKDFRFLSYGDGCLLWKPLEN